MTPPGIAVTRRAVSALLFKHMGRLLGSWRILAWACDIMGEHPSELMLQRLLPRNTDHAPAEYLEFQFRTNRDSGPRPRREDPTNSRITPY